MNEEITEKNLRDPMPDETTLLDEVIEFWDTHSTADYEDEMEEVNFEIDIQEEVFLF